MDFFYFEDDPNNRNTISDGLQGVEQAGLISEQILDEMLYHTGKNENNTRKDQIESTGDTVIRESYHENLEGTKFSRAEKAYSNPDTGGCIRSHDLGAQIHAMDLFAPSLKEKGSPFLIVGDKENMLRAYSLNDEMSPLFVLGEHIESRHKDTITCIKCYQPPGEDTIVVVSGSRDRTLRIWVVQSLSSFKELRGHEDTVWCVDVITQNDVEPLVVSGGIDGFLIVWSMLRGEKLREIYLGDQRAIFCLSAYLFQNKPKVLFGGEDEMITLWSIESGEVVRTYLGHSDAVYDIAVMNGYCSEPHKHFSVQSQIDDIMATGGKDHMIIIWSITTGMQLRCFYSHRSDVFSLTLVPTLFGRRGDASGEDLTTTRESWKDQRRRIATEEQAARALYGDDGEVDSDDEVEVERGGVWTKRSGGAVDIHDGISPFSKADSKTEYIIDAVIISGDKNGNIITANLTCGSILRRERYHHGAVRCVKCHTKRVVQSSVDSAATSLSLDTGSIVNPLLRGTDTSRYGGSHSTSNHSISMHEDANSHESRIRLNDSSIVPTITVYSGGMDKTLMTNTLRSFTERAWRAYDLDKRGKLLPVKILNQMPDKYRRWSNIYSLIQKSKLSIDSFFMSEAFILFQQAIIDGENDFVETFLPDCLGGLEMSSYFTVHEHGYDIFEVRKIRFKGTDAAFFKRMSRKMRNYFIKMKRSYCDFVGYKLEDTTQRFSLLRTALDHTDVRSTVVILDAWTKLLNQPARDWLYQCKGSYTRLLNDDLVLCSNLYPALFVDFILKIKLQVCHPYISTSMNTPVPPNEEFVCRGCDANLKLDKAMWKVPSGGPPIPTNCGLFVPLPHVTDFAMIQAYVKVSEKMESAKIFSSVALQVGVKLAWSTYGRTSHFMLIGLFISTVFSFFLLWYSETAFSSNKLIFLMYFILLSISLETLKEFMVVIWKEDALHALRFDTLITFMYFSALTICVTFVVRHQNFDTITDTDMALYITATCGAVGVVWIKGFKMLTSNRSIGPIIATVEKVIWDTRYLIMMIFLIVIAFTMAFWVLCAPELGGTELWGLEFNDWYWNKTIDPHPYWLESSADFPSMPAQKFLPAGYFSFSTLQGSFLTTYTYIMGQYDITNFNTCGMDEHGNQNDKVRNFAIFLSVVFVALVSIVMINVLIALMTESYSRSVHLGYAQTYFEQARIMISHHPVIVISETMMQRKRNMSLTPKLLLVLTSGVSDMATVAIGGDQRALTVERDPFVELLNQTKKDAENIDEIITTLDDDSSEMFEEQLQRINVMTTRLESLMSRRRNHI